MDDKIGALRGLETFPRSNVFYVTSLKKPYIDQDYWWDWGQLVRVTATCRQGWEIALIFQTLITVLNTSKDYNGTKPAKYKLLP